MSTDRRKKNLARTEHLIDELMADIDYLKRSVRNYNSMLNKADKMRKKITTYVITLSIASVTIQNISGDKLFSLVTSLVGIFQN
jgi:hypothetical protein